MGNGVFAVYVDGARIFSLVDSVELRTAFEFFKKMPIDGVGFGRSDVAAIKVFENAYKYFVGDGEALIEGVLSLTCTAMGDSGLNVYLMRSPSGDRVIWSLDCGVMVSECVLDTGAFSGVVGDIPLIFMG
ncbi:Imm42 family immunity protein [Pseudomonas sp. JS3066]|uniref:Imm42 family immunity protein n=1 Tax=Pseudomonas sp. JS3066 TaxID=3090665 RepID=UPI003FA6A354